MRNFSRLELSFAFVGALAASTFAQTPASTQTASLSPSLSESVSSGISAYHPLIRTAVPVTTAPPAKLAPAQADGATSFPFNLSAGVFLPTDSKIRAIFGSSPIAYGFGLGRNDRLGRTGWGFDLAGLFLNAPGNRINMFGGTYGFESQNRTGDNSLSFFRAGAGLAYYDFNIAPAGVTVENGSRLAFLGALEGGVVFSRNLTFSAQYLLTPKFGAYDFSGLRLQATFTF